MDDLQEAEFWCEQLSIVKTALRSGTRRCCVLGQGAQHGIEQIRILKVAHHRNFATRP